MIYSERPRAVWSYWTKPTRLEGSDRWLESQYQLMSWALSFETARKHFPSTALITDAPGAQLLVNDLGLEFDAVDTTLEALHDEDANWWILGKLTAYASQDRPFVHIDGDVYLWRPLPQRLLPAPVLGQNPEPFGLSPSYYQPEVIENAVADGGWLPSEWTWVRRRRNSYNAVSCRYLRWQQHRVHSPLCATSVEVTVVR